MVQATWPSGCSITALAVLVGFAASATAQPDIVERSIESLKARDQRKRQRAAGRLAQLGEGAARALPVLVGILESEQEDLVLRDLAKRAIACIGPAATPRLIKLLKHKDLEVRQAAAETLCEAGPAAAAAAEELVRLLRETGYSPRKPLQDALTEIGPSALPYLLPHLAEWVVPPATYAHFGKAAVPGLVALLRSDQQATREAAAIALTALGPNAAEATPALAVCLEDPRFGDRTLLVDAVAAIGPAAAKAIPALLARLQSTHRAREADRLHEVRALGRIGPTARPAIPKLKDLLSHGNAGAKAAAGLALWRISAEVAPVVASWRALLRSGDAAKALPVLAAIRRMGPPAAPLIKEVMDWALLLDRPMPAEQALASIGRDAATALTGWLDDPRARRRALSVLSELGPDAAPAVSGLLQLTEAADPAIRKRALYILGSIGATAKGGLADRVAHIAFRHLRDDETLVAALSVLARIPATDEGALPELARLLKHESLGIVEGALAAIARMGPAAAELVPQLIEGCERGRFRWAGFDTLGAIGPSARAAVPMLRQYVTDPNPGVRMATAIALWRMTDDEAELAPLLRELESPLAATRIYAVQIVGGLKNPPPDVVGALAKVLRDSDWRVRREGARSLGLLRAQSALPALRELAGTPQEDERVRATASASVATLS